MLTVPAMQVCNRIELVPSTVPSIEIAGRQGIDDAEGGVQERTDRQPKDARLSVRLSAVVQQVAVC